MAQNKNPQKQSNRERLLARYAQNDPTFNGEDDEALYGAAADELGKADESAAQRKRFSDAVANVDIAPEMMSGILSGKNPDGSDFDLEDYLFEQHMDFFMDYLENKDGAKEKLAARKKARKAEEEEEATFKKDLDKKVKAEDAELDAALQESGYRPEQVKALIDWIYDADKGIVVRASRFELTKDDFLKLFKLKDYDLKMSEAEERGRKSERNKKIDMFQRKQEQRRQMPPDVNGGGGRPMGKQKEADPQLAALARMANAY